MRVAVVTGAAGGIGRALAERLAADGHVVHTVDRLPTDHLAASLGGVAHLLDVTDPVAMEALARRSAPTTTVCLNAGVVGPSVGAPWEVADEEWNDVLQVNLLGIVNGLRVFLPRLLQSERPARVLITASLAGLLTWPQGGVYGVSKHAVVGLAEHTALCLRGTNVSVTLLCPGLVRTGMSQVGQDAGEVAAGALRALRAGQFLVVPNEWRTAIKTRTERLVDGSLPQVPVPVPTSGRSAGRGRAS